MKTIVLLLLCLCPVIGAAPQAPWWQYALRLTGESDAVRERSIGELKKIPHLEEALSRALLTDKKELALDVTSALNLESMLPQLVVLSEKDGTGLIHLALNTFAHSKNAEALSVVYRRQLNEHGTKIEFRLSTSVIIDTLARLRVSLRKDELLPVWEAGGPELRSVILYYARHMRTDSYRWIIEMALRESMYQLRLQAFFLLSEFTDPKSKELLTTCRNDPATAVREACEKFAGSLP